MRVIYAFILSSFLTFYGSSCDTTRAENSKEANQTKGKKNKEGRKAKKENEPASTGITVDKKWELPAILQEISGFAYMGSNRFACVQDESGVIFIYNATEDKIEKQISFGAAGDYEGLTLVGNTAYVVRSDGQLFRVRNINSQEKPTIQSYATGLTAKNNVEGLTYDKQNNCLLLAIKGDETDEKDYKGIYAFDLTTHKLKTAPVFKIKLADPAFQNRQSKKLSAAIQPSDLAINPLTNELYVIEATNPQVVILDSQGQVKSRFVLNKKEFTQPEGISFSPSGDLYISNEGKKEKGNILQVSLGEQAADL